MAGKLEAAWVGVGIGMTGAAAALLAQVVATSDGGNGPPFLDWLCLGAGLLLMAAAGVASSRARAETMLLAGLTLATLAPLVADRGGLHFTLPATAALVATYFVNLAPTARRAAALLVVPLAILPMQLGLGDYTAHATVLLLLAHLLATYFLLPAGPGRFVPAAFIAGLLVVLSAAGVFAFFVKPGAGPAALAVAPIAALWVLRRYHDVAQARGLVLRGPVGIPLTASNP